MFVEEATLENTVRPDGTTERLLALTGRVRARPTSANRLIYIPGLGDHEIERIVACPSHFTNAKAAVNPNEIDQDVPSTTFGQVLDARDGEQADPMIAFNEPDDLDAEQTWPTEEELQAGDGMFKL